MVDDGYLVGYEDGSGNFVEVGRFNNTSENVSDPLIIQHSDSGQQMELGPDGFSTDSVSTVSQSVDESVSRMFLSQTQSVLDTTETKISLDTVSGSDPLNVADVNNSKMVLPEGEYVVASSIQYKASTGWSDGDFCISRIKIGGATVVDPVHPCVGANVRQVATLATTVEVGSGGGDLELFTFQNSGGSKDVEGIESRTYLSVSRSG